MASSSLSNLSAQVGEGLVSLWIMTLSDQLQQASTQNLSLFFLGLICTFQTKTCASPGHRAPSSPSWVLWWLDSPVVFILVYNCLNWWTWHLQNIWKLHPKMDQTYGAPKFSPWFFGWFLLIFPLFQTRKQIVWGTPLKYITRCAFK